MSAPLVVSLLLMVFVLLAPTLMVALLISGLARRPLDAEVVDPTEPVEAYAVGR